MPRTVYSMGINEFRNLYEAGLKWGELEPIYFIDKSTSTEYYGAGVYASSPPGSGVYVSARSPRVLIPIASPWGRVVVTLRYAPVLGYMGAGYYASWYVTFYFGRSDRNVVFKDTLYFEETVEASGDKVVMHPRELVVTVSGNQVSSPWASKTLEDTPDFFQLELGITHYPLLSTSQRSTSVEAGSGYGVMVYGVTVVLEDPFGELLSTIMDIAPFLVAIMVMAMSTTLLIRLVSEIS